MDMKSLEECTAGMRVAIVSVKDSSSLFLKYLDKIEASIGTAIEVLDRVAFDGSLEIILDSKSKVFVSREVAKNIMVI